MSGTKQYDRTALLERAAEEFRVQGFTDTGRSELVAELVSTARA